MCVCIYIHVCLLSHTSYILIISISRKHFVIIINYEVTDYVHFSVLLCLPFPQAETLTLVFTLSCHLSRTRVISYCVQPLLIYQTTASKTELRKGKYTRRGRCKFLQSKVGQSVERELCLESVDKKNQLDVTLCILYFSSNSCSTCFGQPCAHHQELTTAWCYSLVVLRALDATTRCHFLYSLFLF